jgi:hypothetical protein
MLHVAPLKGYLGLLYELTPSVAHGFKKTG